MKRIGSTISVIILAALFALPASANDIRKDIGEVRYDRAVKNLLVGVGDDNQNCGLRRSAIYMLGELGAKDAVIPLMKVLRSCPDQKSRIAAAWALCKIGDSRGSYAVKQTVRFDDNTTVRLHCAWYYNLYVSEGTFAFLPSESSTTQIAELR